MDSPPGSMKKRKITNKRNQELITMLENQKIYGGFLKILRKLYGALLEKQKIYGGLLEKQKIYGVFL